MRHNPERMKIPPSKPIVSWQSVTQHKATVSLFLLLAVAAGFFAYTSHRERVKLLALQHRSFSGEGPELSEVLNDLKRQIVEEEEQTARENIADSWGIRNIDLEISFTVKEEQTTEGKFESKLVAVTDTSSISGERIQKVTFHLEPKQLNFPRVGGAINPLTAPPPPKQKDIR